MAQVDAVPRLTAARREVSGLLTIVYDPPMVTPRPCDATIVTHLPSFVQICADHRVDPEHIATSDQR
jgi:hypothetical protein